LLVRCPRRQTRIRPRRPTPRGTLESCGRRGAGQGGCSRRESGSRVVRGRWPCRRYLAQSPSHKGCGTQLYESRFSSSYRSGPWYLIPTPPAEFTQLLLARGLDGRASKDNFEESVPLMEHPRPATIVAVTSHILLHGGKTSKPELMHWLDPQQGSVLFFREHVEQAVRPLPYIADALP
jgi:hypothetical protein